MGEVKTKFESFTEEEKAIINNYFKTKLGLTFEDFISKFRLICEKHWSNVFGKISEEKTDNGLCDFCGILTKTLDSNYCNACKHENLS